MYLFRFLVFLVLFVLISFPFYFFYINNITEISIQISFPNKNKINQENIISPSLQITKVVNNNNNELYFYNQDFKSDSNIIQQINNNYDNDNINIIFPKSLRKCERNEIFIEFKNGILIEELEKKRVLFDIEIACSAEEHEEDVENTAFDNFISRKFKPLIDIIDNRLISLFFADDITEICNISVFYNNNKLDNREYIVDEVSIDRMHFDWCWHCAALYHIDSIPLASQFIIVDKEGNNIWNSNTVFKIKRNEILELYVIPLPEIIQEYPLAVNSTLLHGRIKNDNIIQNIVISYEYQQIPDGRFGYKITIEGKDTGEYQLDVIIYWFYANSEPYTNDREPILLGSHIFHELSLCDIRRSEIYGSGLSIEVYVDNPSEKDIISPNSPLKCTTINEQGRWIWIDINESCTKPFCTGDRLKTLISDHSWQGAKLGWVWVPYNCYYHFYNVDDVSYCANALNYKWIHVMGDSVAREFVGYLMSLFLVPDTSKFEQASVLLNDNLRISFLAWPDIVVADKVHRNKTIVKDILDHYNIFNSSISIPLHMEEYSFYMELTEIESPDLFIMNPAIAYSLFKQQTKDYEDFIIDFKNILNNNEIIPRTFWYSSPSIFGTAHEGTEYITHYRASKFANISQHYFKDTNSIEYFDVMDITKSRMEETWDGLHYLSGYEEWRGHVASTVVQIWLNQVFGECNPSND